MWYDYTTKITFFKSNFNIKLLLVDIVTVYIPLIILLTKCSTVKRDEKVDQNV